MNTNKPNPDVVNWEEIKQSLLAASNGLAAVRDIVNQCAFLEDTCVCNLLDTLRDNGKYNEAERVRNASKGGILSAEKTLGVVGRIIVEWEDELDGVQK